MPGSTDYAVEKAALSHSRGSFRRPVNVGVKIKVEAFQSYVRTKARPTNTGTVFFLIPSHHLILNDQCKKFRVSHLVFYRFTVTLIKRLGDSRQSTVAGRLKTPSA